MKALYALVIVLFSYAAPAQASEDWLAPYYLDDLDCLGEMTQPSPQINGVGLFCAALFNDVDDDAITGAITEVHGAEDSQVGAIQPGDENSTADYSSGSDAELPADDTTEQTAIIETKPAIDHDDAKVNPADEVAMTGPNYAEDVEVKAIQASDESPIAAHSDQGDDQSTADATIEE